MKYLVEEAICAAAHHHFELLVKRNQMHKMTEVRYKS